ncbi:MAG: peptidylprolyl isomerase [Alphaproteobacteria bacterium]|nr:peptidylprolyl isomerase [Alphaproteobacteria bacterium]
MIRTIPFAAIALLLSVLFAQMTANAGVTIIATVNGKPITNYDVEQRSRFLGYATNIEITDQNRDRLYEDSLQLIIEDKLRLEAARDMLPDIEAVVLPQARDFINQNFGNDTTSGNRVLMNDGIDPLTVQQKYTSDLAWSNFISTKFLDKFENIEERVDDEIDRMRQNASKPQIKLAEIVLTPSPTRNIEQTRGLAGDMVAAIRKGASFTEIARQYSVSGSSARGGDVGWAMSEKLPKTFRDALESIENGAVTEPVLLDGAVYILRKSGERKDGIVDASQSRVWLARAILPLAADASDADRLEAGARIVRDTESVTNCEDLGALNATYESNAVSRLNDMVVGDLAPQMQKLVASLEIGVPSEPLSFAEGVASMMVCELLEPQLQLPPREEIRQALIDKIFGSLGERQLQRLRRTAIIERRDG